jgi:DegV family protein with EDD domain
MPVTVVTDSTSYIPERLRAELGIRVVSLWVNFGDETQRELDIDNSAFYARLEGERELPTSSTPPASEFLEVFEDIIGSGDDVVGVFISSDMSATCETAQLARTMVLEARPDAHIEIVDSRSNCMQLGFAALAAARASRAGANVEAAVEAAEQARLRTRYLFVPHTLDYLRKGGRIGGASALLGGILQIRPILTVEEGKTQVFAKVRTKSRAMAEMVRQFAEDRERCGLRDVVVHHIHDEEEGRLLVDLVAEVTGSRPELIGVGAVIGLHVGPGAVAIAYETERPIREGV